MGFVLVEQGWSDPVALGYPCSAAIRLEWSVLFEGCRPPCLELGYYGSSVIQTLVRKPPTSVGGNTP